MKRNILVILLLIGLNFLYAQPKFEVVGGRKVDWGKVTPKDNPLKTKITIKNSGDETLEILRVKPTCGCTTAPLSKSKLKPGETAELDVTMKITGATGNYTKYINVYTNDPNAKAAVIDLIAYIQRPLTLKPSSFIPLNNMQVGYSTTGACTITNTSDEIITLNSFNVTPSTAEINVGKKLTLKPGQEFNLIVKVTPNKPGSYKAKISFNTSHKDFPDVVIYAYGSAKKSAIFRNN